MKTTMMRSTRFRLTATAAFLALAVTAAAQDAFTPWHVAKLRTVTAAAIAPDGRHIAYALSVPRIPLQDDDGPAWVELHVATPDGVSRPYVTGHVNISSIAWTAGSDSIAFLAKRESDAHRSIHLVPLGGGEARRLLTHTSDIVAFDLTEDGKRIAFIARPAVPQERRDLEKKGFTQEIYEESVQPQQLFVTEVTNGEPAAPRRIELPGHPSEVSWSPDGARLLVVHAPTPLVDDELIGRRLWIVDASSGSVVTKIDRPGKLGVSAWSPDSQHIAFVGAADRNDPSPGRLIVSPAGGGATKELLPAYEGHVGHVAWKDANTLLYAADEGAWSVIGEVRRDGSAARIVVPTGGPIVSSLDRAKNGAIAVVGHTPRHPSEVFLLPSNTGELKRTTTSNPWLEQMRFAKQEVVTWQARDGLTLEGVLVRPLDEQPGQRYPLILTVHGGPESRDPNGWVTSYSNPGQIGAAQGFAVFYPNYRGSTGRGVEFSKLGQGDPAGKEFDDLVDAVDHLVKTGLVDRGKVGITGGSYGGYASAWGATFYSDRFAAAVMFVGISDTISKLGTTDIAQEEFDVHARRQPWDDWEFALKRSPIYYADRSKTPTLILHGKEDPRVHPSQSLELYRNLKLRGQAPVRLVWYPGEGHGNRRAASRLDYNLRLMRWMTHYLKGPGGEMPPYELDYTHAPPRAKGSGQP